ncbi:MAG: SGNH/GDSL hydrolase family protein [Luteolibacter sp.]|uniref:SGNH/GDSL hydrolase family protein n=1 Tax=Luteolibacter sp. TaxID=1962973 RepID=UPI0032630F34
MKAHSPLLLALALSCTSVSATEQIVTLGDSLTFAYEAEFCFSQNVVPFGPIGDGFPLTVQNWIEILSKPAYRGSSFGLGTPDNVTVTAPGNPPFSLYFRQSQNWAIPGLKIDGLRRFITGDPTATFTSLMGADSDFSTLGSLLTYSDFNNATDFNVTDLQNQIQGTAQRLTICIGGNDIKEIYGTVYNGGSAGTFVADFMADMVAILDRVQTLNPNIQIVVVNVPHVGITPKVNVAFPYHPTNTERVSVVLRDLNSQLSALAETRHIGYADIYTPTLPMLDGVTKLCIHGIQYNNTVTNSGGFGPVWLSGPISSGFHPNTNAQTVIANQVIHAFNKRYHSGLPPLTATEMLISLSNKTLSDIDMPFATWMNKYGLNGLPASNDADGDGIPAGTEFAMGLNPLLNDADLVNTGIVAGALDFSYPIRLPSSAMFTLVPESSTTLTAPFTPFAVVPTTGADGLAHARLTLGATPKFLRVKATIP